MQKLWSTEVGRVFLESYYFGYFSFRVSFSGNPLIFSLLSPDPLSPDSLPLGLTLAGRISAVRPPQGRPPVPIDSPSPRRHTPTCYDLNHRRNPLEIGRKVAPAAKILTTMGLHVSGQIGRNTQGDLEAPGQADPAPPFPTKSVAGRRRIKKLFPASQPGFEAILDPFRSFLDLVSVMKNDPCVVMMFVLKFHDHRRWLDRRSVGLTRRRLGRRVAARPASLGGPVWPKNYYFRLRTCWCMLCMILAKFENLYNCLSVRNRTANILEYCVTVGWLPNLIGMLR
jgi:hypothetical protein